MDFQLDTSPLCASDVKLAEEELRETPENVALGLEELRKLLKANEELSFADDDATLTAFLRPCKWYAQSAYELMVRVADFRKKYSSQLKNLMPEDVKEFVVEHNVVNILKGVDQKGRRVLVVNCGGSWDTSKVSSDVLFKIFYLIHEAALVEQASQVRGVVVVMDFKGMGMKQVASLNPAFSMKLLGFIQEAMPLRLKEVHMVNEPFIFNIVWKIFTPFLKEKLKNRIFFHGSKMAKLHKFLEPSHLPKNYGGQLPEINYTSADWYPTLEAHMDHMKKWSGFGYKED